MDNSGLAGLIFVVAPSREETTDVSDKGVRSKTEVYGAPSISSSH